jgi:conjugative transfer pilus assembly protein TraH
MTRPHPHTTRPIQRLSRIALCGLLASGLIAAPMATGGGLEDFYNSVSAYNNVTSPQAYHGQAMNIYTGGSLFMRTPSRNYQLVNVAAPSLRGGCGGIDAFAGSFSFINSDQLVAMLRNIGQNALGLIFMIALQSMAPDIMETIKYLNKIAQDVNSMNISSCEAAKSLVAASGVEKWMEANKVNTGLGAAMAGLYDDWSKVRTKLFGDSAEVAQKAAALKATNPNVASQLIEGNLVWRAINKGSLPSYLSEKERRMVMSAIGAVIVKKKENGDPDPGFYEPVLSFKRLLGNIDGSDIDGKPQIFTCRDGTGADECTVLGTEPFDSKPFSQLAYERMFAIYEKIVNRGPALNPGEIDFINSTSVPVYKILATAASMRTQSVAEEQIIKNADVIGAELAATFMLKALDEVERALEHRSKVSTVAEAEAIKSLIDKARDRRKSIYSEKAVLTAKATGVYNLMSEMHFLEKTLFGNLSDGVAANLRFAHSMRKTR